MLTTLILAFAITGQCPSGSCQASPQSMPPLPQKALPPLPQKSMPIMDLPPQTIYSRPRLFGNRGRSKTKTKTRTKTVETHRGSIGPGPTSYRLYINAY